MPLIRAYITWPWDEDSFYGCPFEVCFHTRRHCLLWRPFSSFGYFKEGLGTWGRKTSYSRQKFWDQVRDGDRWSGLRDLRLALCGRDVLGPRLDEWEHPE